jgi:hypothetical protein
MHHRSVAQAQPRREIGRIQDRAHFLHRQMRDELLIVPLCRDGADLPDLLQGRRDLIFDIVLCQACSDAFKANLLPRGVVAGGGSGEAVPGNVDGGGA